MLLSILICTVPERQTLMANLWHKLEAQRIPYRESVQIIYDATGKEISVGTKRQRLLERAKGKWIVFFDDDDDPADNYIELILTGILTGDDDIDCMGINELMTTNGTNPQTWCHRLGYPISGDGRKLTDYGFHYVRPIIHFNPVLREKALQAGFRDMRYGEDMDYAARLNPLLKKEYNIEEPLFHYRYSSAVPHNEKYGIK